MFYFFSVHSRRSSNFKASDDSKHNDSGEKKTHVWVNESYQVIQMLQVTAL